MVNFEIHLIDSSRSGTSPGLQIADPARRDPDALYDRVCALALIERALLQVAMSY